MRAGGLIVATLVLAGLGVALYISNKDEEKKAAKPPADTTVKIVSLLEPDIKKIEIKAKNEDTVLERGSGNKWQITAPAAYGADQDAATNLAFAVANIAADRVIEEKAADLGSYGLKTPSVEVDIGAKNGKTTKVLLGDDNPTGSTTYAMLAGDPRVFSVISSVKTGLSKSAKDLRDKRLLTFDQDKVSRLELQAQKQDIEFGRDKDQWQIVKPQPLRADGLQVEELLRKVKDAKMDLSLSDEDLKKAASAFAAGAPVATVKVTDPSGAEELQVRKNKDDYYAKSSVVEGIYKVSSDLGDGVNKALDDFRNKKLFDFGFSDPDKVELHAGGKNYSFQKSGDDWLSSGKKMDSISVQNLIDKLREISAAKFVDTGFTTPAIDVAVTSNQGKRVEKVSFSKADKTYIARRENEPSLYEVTAKNVDDMVRAAADVKEAAPVKKK
ncbi:MAG TPA: DUF4340 domain-containing protein [Bryobacteraceae bacterium]|nr:DUF4340 domain-containing protein [Bryobacteraceae bacterium]